MSKWTSREKTNQQLGAATQCSIRMSDIEITNNIDGDAMCIEFSAQ